MFFCVKSLGVYGLDAFDVAVEVDTGSGLPTFDIVGLPDAAVKESRDRVRAAIKNAGFDFPLGRITVNLAPADTKKAGSVYDLPICIAILAASKQLKANTEDYAFFGELSLDGKIRGVRGALSMTMHAKKQGIKKVILPYENRYEAGVVEGIDVLPATHIKQVVEHLCAHSEITAFKSPAAICENPAMSHLDFADIKGQRVAKRACEIAACGNHNILFIGPPGSGKSMLAKRMGTIMPPMSFEQQLQSTQIHSVAGLLPPNVSLLTNRPFRSPHHTISNVGLSGGGTIPRPGEISLAHGGVLFLDEFAEFSRSAIEALRQPMEDKTVTITRAASTLTYPCNFLLVAAMNPCPCGWRGHPTHPCTCSPSAIERYINRVSGPVLDRIDLHIQVHPVDYQALSTSGGETSAQILQRVIKGRQYQLNRQAITGVECNADLPPAAMEKVCTLTPQAEQVLKSAFEKLGFSARGRDKILKVARTIADLSDSEVIQAAHMHEAIAYRSLDRSMF